MISARLALLLLSLALATGCPSKTPPQPPASGDRILVNVDEAGVGLEGHDPTAYAAAGEPVLGSEERTAAHGGAVYWFSSSDAQAAFEAAPDQQVPAYGGYCAFAAAQNRLSPADPTVWKILDGQLLVFTNQDFLADFDEDPAGNKQRADRNWPGLVAEHGVQAQ